MQICKKEITTLQYTKFKTFFWNWLKRLLILRLIDY